MIADFGISTIAATSVGTTTAQDTGGSLNWMAPELVIADYDVPRPTTKSDMWAFGCICYEVTCFYAVS
jgi:serine/threonine protein kinase